MARGFLSGIIWGGVVSVIGAGTVSVIAKDPVPPVVGVEAPEGERAPEAGAPSTASAVTDADLVRNSDTRRAARPEADDVTAAVAAGSDTPTVPQTGGADDLARPADGADSGGVTVTEADPVAPSAPASAPTVPGAEEDLSISTDPAQPAAPDVPETASAFAPVDAPEDAPEINVDTARVSVPEQPAPTTPPETTDVAALPDTDPTQPAGGPAIGRPAGSLLDRGTGAAAQDEADAATPVNDGRAITAHAMPFENPDDKPLMSIVLLDNGADLTGGAVGVAALQSFPYPLTFAVDATLPDATERMADYRAQGFEVMALLDLPPGATPGDAEVALSAALNAVPEAVAVIEGTGTGIQESRDTSDQIAQALLDSGHGLVLQSKGLNTAQKLAARSGVPAGLIFRDFDSADQTPSVIRRFLDQAAFRAGVEGGVIMVGRVRPDTISALLLWGLQDRAERVALAPVSAVLTALEVPAQ